MKKILPLMLIAFLLTGCAGFGKTASDADMATRVAQILTSMPGASTQTNSPASTTVPPAAVTDIIKIPTETATTAVTETPILAPAVTNTETATTTATTQAVTPTLSVTAGTTVTTNPNVTATPDVNVGGGVPGQTTTSPGTPLPSVTAPASDPRLKFGTPSATDPMDKSSTWGWPVGANEFTSIDFSNGSLVLTGLTDVSGWRLPIIAPYKNMYIEAVMRPDTCSGMDSYGIISRVPVLKEADRGYLFAITCDGRYALWKWDGKVQPKGKATMLVYWKANNAILKGANQSNRMGMMTVDNRLILYVNGVKLDEVLDKDYPSGYFGVFVNPDKTKNFTVRIDEMSYWANITP